jgi:hypothetical protein
LRYTCNGRFFEEGRRMTMKRVMLFKPLIRKQKTGNAVSPAETGADTHPPPALNKRIFCFLRGEAPAAIQKDPPEIPISHATYNVKSLRLFCSPFIKIRKA